MSKKKFYLTIGDEKFETSGHIPAWNNVMLMRAERAGDGEAMVDALFSLIESIIVDEDWPRFQQVANTYDALSEDFYTTFANATAEWMSEVSSNPKDSTK